MIRRLLTLIASTLLCAALVFAQGNANKKSYMFHGKVESMDAASKSMSVNGEKVAGWMDAMTMKYKIDNADVFKTAKVGDAIEATVYDGDYTLYKVHVMKDQAKPDQKK